MPRQNDHPLVEMRAQHGLGVTQMSKLAGVSRATLIALEEGRTRTMSKSVALALEAALALPVQSLQSRVDAWFAGRSPRASLTNRARAVLDLPPHRVTAEFASFSHWRQQISDSPTSFASLIGVNRGVVANYESKVRHGDMTVNLMSQIENALDVSHAYVVELAKLEPSS